MRPALGAGVVLCVAVASSGCTDPFDDPSGVVVVPGDEDDTGLEPGDDDTTPPPPDVNGVVLLVVDTLRADRVGCGERPGLMPTVEAMLANGSCFLRAKSNAPWTSPSTATILSGTHGQTHEVIDQATDELSPSVDLAPDMLTPQGWVVAMASANHAATNAGILERFPLDYNNEYETEVDDRKVDQYLVEHVREFLDEQVTSPDTKFFLHVQMYSPHFPFCPEDPSISTFYGGDFDFCRLNDGTAIGDAVLAGDQELLEAALTLYDEEVAAADEQVAALLQLFEERGLSDTTLFAFAADHGEAFDEHGHWGHSAGLTFDQIDVPLGFWGPGVTAGSVAPQAVSTADILPTLFDYAGLEVPAEVEGRSLRPLIEDPEGDHVTRAYSILGSSDGERHYGITTNLPDGTTWTLLDMPAVTALYHTETDPTEAVDQAGEPATADVQAMLQEMLDEPELHFQSWYDRFVPGE